MWFAKNIHDNLKRACGVIQINRQAGKITINLSGYKGASNSMCGLLMLKGNFLIGHLAEEPNGGPNGGEPGHHVRPATMLGGRAALIIFTGASSSVCLDVPSVEGV